MKYSLLRRPMVVALLGWHALLAVGPGLSPHPVSTQYRDHADAPPTAIHWSMENGALAWPYVCLMQPDPVAYGRYFEDCTQRFPLSLLSRRADGALAILGVEAPGALYLLGTDELGRDVFSRLLAGGMLSLVTGLSAACIALGIAALVGGVSGFWGGWVDGLLSRGGEVLMALPALYLLLAMRAALPIQTPPLMGFGIAVLLISLMGWARPARLVRGVVLSARERGFVLAARGFGAGAGYLLWRHVLPQTRGVLAAQAALLVPRFVLLEVTLSFLGLGVPEPTASWGTMLSSLRQYPLLASHWWMLSPAVALSVSLLLFGGWAQTLEQSRRERLP